jgi:hypothetical protein
MTYYIINILLDLDEIYIHYRNLYILAKILVKSERLRSFFFIKDLIVASEKEVD